MPTITQTPAQGYAHCPDSLCDGNEQIQVQAILERSDRTYKEWSDGSGLPSMPGVENTTERLLFANDGQNGRPDDTTCAHCGRRLELSNQPRPVYPVMVAALGATNTDQRLLLKLAQQNQIKAPGADGANQSDEVEQLRRQVAELGGMVQGFMAGQAAPPAEPQDHAPPKPRGRRGQPAEGA